MNKTTKGALGATAAAVLLLGGVGSLAYWTDDATVNGGDVTAGYLDLTAGTCDAEWAYAPDNAQAGAPVVNFVPGDSITKDCTFTINGAGDNLQATPTVPTTVDITPTPAAPSFDAEVAATYAIGATPITGASVITEENDGDTLTATIVVTIPYGTDETGTPVVNGNDTERIVAALDDLTVTLTQTDA